jgi:hypothetical protein
MDHYLKGEPAAPELTRLSDGIAVLRCDSEIGHADLNDAQKAVGIGK